VRVGDAGDDDAHDTVSSGTGARLNATCAACAALSNSVAGIRAALAGPRLAIRVRRSPR
jgi:hypothetical protein